MIYTIVQTAADADRGFFPDPFAWESYYSIDQARKRLAKLIAKEKRNLDSRFDTENLSDYCWEVCEADYAAAHFLRIEILSSEMSPAKRKEAA